MKPNRPTENKDLDTLVGELSRGSVDAYSEIYRRYYNRLFRYALQIHYHPAFVEDVLQDFFTYLAENCRRLRRVAHFEVYLFQSVKRNVLARLAREKQSNQSRDRYQQRMAPLADRFADAPDQELIDREELHRRKDRIREELAKLPEHQRETLYLRYFEELSYREICEVLGVSNQVARNYASRGIKQLKQALWNTELLFSLFLLFS